MGKPTHCRFKGVISRLNCKKGFIQLGKLVLFGTISQQKQETRRNSAPCIFPAQTLHRLHPEVLLWYSSQLDPNWLFGPHIETRELNVLLSLTVYYWQVRFYALYINPTRIHQRRFDPSGKEIEPNFSDTRKVNTGYLMSSFSKLLLINKYWSGKLISK